MLLSTQTDVVFRTLGEKDGIDVLARAGYDAIDFSMFPMSHDACPLNTCDIDLYAKNLRKMASDAGLVFNQAHAPFPGWRVGDDAYNAKMPERVVRAVKIAGMLGAKAVVVHPIAVPGGGEKQKEFNLNYYRDMERQLSTTAQKSRLRICGAGTEDAATSYRTCALSARISATTTTS